MVDNHVKVNRKGWDLKAPEFFPLGRRAWACDEISWGMFGVPDSQLRIMPTDLAGCAAIELGCGTAYFSAWLSRLGANPVGLDNSPAQLASALQFQNEFDLDFPLILGNAEATPFPDNSFDFALSEYGASIWCDPYRWIPEAHRILKPGARLVFLRNGTLSLLTLPVDDLTAPSGELLARDLFGMYRFDWEDDGTVEFHLPHGEMIKLFVQTGFEIEDLTEVQVPPDATTDFPYITVEWAQRWPAEEIWTVRKK